MTLSDFAPIFLAFTTGRCRASTVRAYRLQLERYILPRLGAKALPNITTMDAAHLHASMRSTPVQANRVVCALSRVLKVARLHGMSTRQVERPPLYREQGRTRFLSSEEQARLLKILEGEPSIASRLITLILLTGLRKSEALHLRWDEVDLSRRFITLQDSKTGVSVRPLSREAAHLLASLPRVGEFVFPGAGARGHLVMVERLWRRLRRDAGLSDVCLHDLRHSFASRLVEAGVPLYTVGKCLGHKTVRMTARYAHLAPSSEGCMLSNSAARWARYDDPGRAWNSATCCPRACSWPVESRLRVRRCPLPAKRLEGDPLS